MSSISKSSTQLLASSEPSICIPRVFENITQERIAGIFGDLFGPRAVKRIDLIKRENEKGERYQRAFIHFNEWPSTSEAQAMRRQLLAGQEVKIVYDDPWFWKCSMNESRKRETQPQPRAPRAPFIVMEETDRAPVHPRDYREDRRCDDRRREDRRPDYREERHREDRRPDYRDERRDDRHLRTTYDSRRDERDQRYSERERHQHQQHQRRAYSPVNRRPTTQHNCNAPRKPKLALMVDTSINVQHHHEIMQKFEKVKNVKPQPVVAAASEQESPRYSPTTPPGTPPKAANADA